MFFIYGLNLIYVYTTVQEPLLNRLIKQQQEVDSCVYMILFHRKVLSFTLLKHK